MSPKPNSFTSLFFFVSPSCCSETFTILCKCKLVTLYCAGFSCFSSPFRRAALIIEDRPIEYEVILVTLTEEEGHEQPAEERVVGTILEAQAMAIVHVGDEFRGEVLAQLFTGDDIFFSMIFSYFSFFEPAVKLCQGKLPRLKYINT